MRSCAEQLKAVLKRLAETEVKARKWDMLSIMCHRFGNRCQEMKKAIEERSSGL